VREDLGDGGRRITIPFLLVARSASGCQVADVVTAAFAHGNDVVGLKFGVRSRRAAIGATEPIALEDAELYGCARTFGSGGQFILLAITATASSRFPTPSLS
jgi:hypothetical protein